MAKAPRVGNDINLSNRPAPYCEPEYDEQPSAWSYDESHGSVHERRLCVPGILGEGEGHNYYNLINVPLEIEADGLCAMAQGQLVSNGSVSRAAKSSSLNA